MATTARKKDGGLGKDKRGTSPSNSQTSSNTHSSSRAAASSEKNIPNYLKPTISSRNEPLKLGNKKNNITTGHHHQDNQKLLRRRSFDKPPSSASPRRRSLISPHNRTGSAPAPLAHRERKLPLRSSSLGKHTVSKTPKDVPTKTKTPSFVNKEESCNNNASISCDHEANDKQEDKEDLAKESVYEEVVNNKEESETSVAVSKSETETETEEVVQHHDVVETEDDAKTNSCDTSTCTSEDQNLIPESRIYDDQQTDEEEKLKDQVKEDRDTQQEDLQIQKEETGGDSTVPEESEDHEKINESAEDEDNSKVEDDKENGEEAAREGRVVEEGEEEEEAAKAVSESPLKDGQGRKESPSAAYYNDVIEETASKLLEKRKNKVRALVGAFETVIDYESAASSK